MLINKIFSLIEEVNRHTPFRQLSKISQIKKIAIAPVQTNNPTVKKELGKAALGDIANIGVEMALPGARSVISAGKILAKTIKQVGDNPSIMKGAQQATVTNIKDAVNDAVEDAVGIVPTKTAGIIGRIKTMNAKASHILDSFDRKIQDPNPIVRQVYAERKNKLCTSMPYLKQC